MSDVRQVADQALGDVSEPKESVALDVVLSFIMCADASQVAYIDKSKSEPNSFFLWKDRWDRESEEFKNGYVAAVSDTIVYLGGMVDVPVIVGTTLLLASVGVCGWNNSKLPSKVKTQGELLKLAEKAITDAGNPLQSTAQTITIALRKCNATR